jgi:hypothetical protein
VGSVAEMSKGREPKPTTRFLRITVSLVRLVLTSLSCLIQPDLNLLLTCSFISHFVPVAARSEAWTLRSWVRIPVKALMFVLVFLCCVLRRWRPLRRADHSCKGVLPGVLQPATCEATKGPYNNDCKGA